MHKIERLMAIILALKKNNKMTANDLSKMFEVDTRTIYRDIQALSEMNVPVVAQPGPEGGYSIMGDYFISPIIFNKEELFAMMMAKKAITETYTPGYYKYIESAFLKIENVMKIDDTKGYVFLNEKIMFEKTSKTTEREDYSFFKLIKEALECCTKIKIKLFDSENAASKIDIIHPYGILYFEDDWITVCFSEGNKKIISININDMKDAELLNNTYSIPGDFDMEDYYCKNHCIMKCTHKKNETVKIKISKPNYRKIKDYIFFHTAEVEDTGDDYILTNKVSNPKCYMSLAFRFFDIIEIIEPTWLRQEFIIKLENLMIKYKKY